MHKLSALPVLAALPFALTGARAISDPFITPTDLYYAQPQIKFKCNLGVIYHFSALDSNNRIIFNQDVPGRADGVCSTSEISEILKGPPIISQGLFTGENYAFSLSFNDNGKPVTYSKNFRVKPTFDIKSWDDHSQYYSERGRFKSHGDTIDLMTDGKNSTVLRPIVPVSIQAYRSANLVTGEMNCPSGNCRLGVIAGSIGPIDRQGGRVETTIDYNHTLHVEEIINDGHSETRRDLIAPKDVSNYAPSSRFTLETAYIGPPSGSLVVYVNGGKVACISGNFSPNSFDGGAGLEFYSSSGADAASVSRFAHTRSRVTTRDCPQVPGEPSFADWNNN